MNGLCNDAVLVAATNVDNYGTMLQAYALQDVLQKEFNLNVPIIDCCYRNKLKQIMRIFNVELLKQKINMISIVSKLKKDEVYWEYWISRKKVFQEFRDKKLLFTNSVNSRDLLMKIVNDKKYVILGSDQVWNPVNLGRDYYTLSFVPDNVCKIAYAPSFGVAKIPFYQKRKTKNYLKRINYLSIREETGKEIIFDLSGREAQVVCDPTLLLKRDRWEEFENNVKSLPENYILCYFLGDSRRAREKSLELQRELKCPIIHFPFLDEYVKGDEMFGDILLNGIGPQEFVYLIHHAKVICTDSFHCSVFSIIFHKEFYSFSRNDKKTNYSTGNRISDLLKRVGLENRMGFETRILSSEEVYSKVDIQMEKIRNFSLQYLEKSLEDKC